MRLITGSLGYLDHQYRRATGDLVSWSLDNDLIMKKSLSRLIIRLIAASFSLDYPNVDIQSLCHVSIWTADINLFQNLKGGNKSKLNQVESRETDFLSWDHFFISKNEIMFLLLGTRDLVGVHPSICPFPVSYLEQGRPSALSSSYSGRIPRRSQKRYMYNLSSMFWVYLEVSCHLDVLRKPPKKAPRRILIRCWTTSTGSF